MTYTYAVLLLLLSAIWGASFLFIKVGVAEMGPLSFAMLRVGIGSLVLWLVIRARRLKLPSDWRTWKHFAFVGFFNALVPFSLMAWGTQYIPSGLSSILNATMPLFTFVLAVVLGAEPLTRTRTVGMLLGFAGILVLTLPKLSDGIEASFWAEMAIVVGSFSYAIATNYAKRHIADQPPLVASLGQVSTGFLFFVPLSLVEQPWTMRPSGQAILALLGLAVLGTALAYILYYRLLQGIGATGTSLVTYIAPIFGVFWGWTILGERLSWHAFAALALILVGMLLVNNMLGSRRVGVQVAPGTERPRLLKKETR
ncbi:MAG: EamA family transporter [Chloroflexi bacterium]|nr:EamA family transporter [Chloroflexota bacterium]